MAPCPPLEVIDLGRRPYEEVHDLQQARLAEVAAGAAPDTLYLVEHDPVITLGRATPDADRPGGSAGIASAAAPVFGARGIPVVEVERGGSATYHGPGQLVGYPIIRLGEGERDIRRYLRKIEDVLIRALADFGIDAGRRESFTGVWAAGRKLASIGIAVRRWTTWHGFALNCDLDLSPLACFRPCGLDAGVYATANELADWPVTLDELKVSVVRLFGEVFGRDIQGVS